MATHCIAFDFQQKRERPVEPADTAAACAAGEFVWVDVDAQAEPAVAVELYEHLRVDSRAREEVAGPVVDGRHDLYDDLMHVTFTWVVFKDDKMTTAAVHLLLGERYLMSARFGAADLFESLRRIYRRDFARFARSGGFLLYEYFDQLVDGYRKAFRKLDRRAERVQQAILETADDDIFTRAADVQRDMLGLRKIMLAAREVLHDLTTRRSPFVPETTLPSLERLVDALERTIADLTVERESLAETLNLYMGIVAHRTNRIVNRLTVLSAVFLPLTFLVGVYGMNFEHIPETRLPYGYGLFWVVCLSIAAGLLYFMKRRKWW